MQEIELKFQVPAAARAAVDKAVAGRESRPRERLQAAYYDTPERALAQAGLALRVRREGRRWVQTLKGSGDDGITRAEHNVALAVGAGQAPAVDPALHAATPVGQRLVALLESAPALGCVFRTDIRRRKRVLRTPHGRVELAFDEGSIESGGRKLAVRELEIELVSGSVQAVIATAQRWVARHGLWLDTRSKAERGDLLARGETMAAPRRGQPVALADTMSLGEARRRVLRSCLDPISANASQIASGVFGDEHVHQLRVGLRRLRTALALFDGAAADPALKEPARALFRRLGAARDAAAVGAPLVLELADALRAIGLALALPLAPAAAAPEPPEAIVRSAPAQALLLELLAQAQAAVAPAEPGDAPLHEPLAARIARWHRQVARDAKAFAGLDDAGRHRLRKRAKRLRYGAEFAGALFERRPLRRYLKAMRKMQDRLGALVDTMIGLDDYKTRADSDPAALFAVGWLAAARERLADDCAPALAEFRRVKRFWKKA
jgi:inorganic triphosphatase YgiF